MVAVVQTAGDLANWHLHVHAIVLHGGWKRDGDWVPAAFVDEHSAELLYRHKVMRLLQDEGLPSDERTELLTVPRLGEVRAKGGNRRSNGQIGRWPSVEDPVSGGIGRRRSPIEQTSQARGGGLGGQWAWYLQGE
jgi:hypothetical protein